MAGNVPLEAPLEAQVARHILRPPQAKNAQGRRAELGAGSPMQPQQQQQQQG